MAAKPLIDLYLRKSRNLREDDHRREQSTDTQEASGRRWADRNGYTVRHVWVDLASGYKADAKRPDFDKALAALRNRETSALWCYMVDRFSRQGARAVLDVIDPADGTEPGRLIFEYDNLDSANERDKRWILNPGDGCQGIQRSAFRAYEGHQAAAARRRAVGYGSAPVRLPCRDHRQAPSARA